MNRIDHRLAPLGTDPASEARAETDRVPALTELLPDPDRACRCIAEYLLDLARRDRLEPTLSTILDAVDEGLEEIERETGRRAEFLHGRVVSGNLRWSARADVLRRSGIDPYYWG